MPLLSAWLPGVNFNTRRLLPRLANPFQFVDSLQLEKLLLEIYREGNGSRREESNTPSTDYDSVALTLSYTGEFLVLQSGLYGDRLEVPGPEIQKGLQNGLRNQPAKASVQPQPDE